MIPAFRLPRRLQALLTRGNPTHGCCPHTFVPLRLFTPGRNTPARWLASPFLVLFALGFVYTSPALLFAQGARQLETIRVFGQGEEFEVQFSQTYQGQPNAEFKPGEFSLHFSATSSSKPERRFTPKGTDALIREIRVVRNKFSTNVIVTLRDAALNMKNRVTFQSQDNLLRVKLKIPTGVAANQTVATPTKKATGSTASTGKSPDKALLKETENRIGGQGTGQALKLGGDKGDQSPLLGDFAGKEFLPSLLVMVFSLVVIISGLYLVLFLYNRYFAPRINAKGGNHSIKQVAAYHIGPKQRVVVMEIDGETIACGVTPQQITYLTHLGGGPKVVRRAVSRAVQQSKGRVSDATESEEEQGAQAGASGDPSDPVQQFAQVLKKRVRSLKRIN